VNLNVTIVVSLGNVKRPFNPGKSPTHHAVSMLYLPLKLKVSENVLEALVKIERFFCEKKLLQVLTSLST